MGTQLKAKIKNQKGFTLIEVLVAVAIMAVIGTGIAAATTQMITVDEQSKSRETVIKEVQNAVHYMIRDVQMAQKVDPTGGSGFPLNLTWVDWDNIQNEVSYTLDSNGNLQRSHSINSGQPTQAVVAQHINTDPSQTNCVLSVQGAIVEGVLNVKITASVSGYKPASESRTVQIIPRPRQS
ncbi:MAG: prepilin-type N-terminal cleavage/methylation domain-containing protein [Dehalococcoidia bacterium]|nr:prepilin-type N-terminal cleavage/methylation domain-containing protein [Dehalococcoidia bacterium]